MDNHDDSQDVMEKLEMIVAVLGAGEWARDVCSQEYGDGSYVFSVRECIRLLWWALTGEEA